MLRLLLVVTITVPDLAIMERAYSEWLGYRVVERGGVGEPLAALWRAPASAGRPYLLMQPESGEPVYLRFVQAEPVEGAMPLKTFGWNATELLVRNPDELAAQLEDSPFRIIGEPRPLSMNPKIRAMQVIGPANEILYLTSIPPGASSFNLGTARSFVDRVFIVVLGGPRMQNMVDFYGGLLGLNVTEPFPARVRVINQAYGLAPEHEIAMALAPLPEKYMVELDEYPPDAVKRPGREGELPTGMAMVSFEVTSLDAPGFELLAPPARIGGAPYGGRRAAVVRGPAGELIELVETPRDSSGTP